MAKGEPDGAASRPRALDVLGALERVARGLAVAATSDDVMRVAFTELANGMAADGAWLFVVAADGKVLELASTIGRTRDLTDRFRRLPIDAPLPIPDAFTRRDTVFVKSPAEFRRRYPAVAPMSRLIRSFVCVPLALDGRCFGVLAVTFNATRRFALAEKRFLAILAGMTAGAVERVRVADEVAVARRDSAALLDFVDALNRTASLDAALSLALDRIGRLLQASRSTIQLRDAGGVMRCVAWRGLSDDFRRAVDGHSPWAADATDPTPIAVTDVDPAPTMKDLLPALTRERIRSLAFVPLVSSGALRGHFTIYFPDRRELAERERQLACAMAVQLALAIDRRCVEAERAQAMQALQSLVAELQQTIALGERVMSILGHDLQNPLMAVRMTAHVLYRQAPAPDIAKRASLIIVSADRMSRMIGQLLDLTRLRLGDGISLRVQPSDAAAICETVVEEIRSANPAAVIAVDAVGDTKGVWDRDRMAEFFSNIVGNAVQHGTDGLVAVYIDGTRPGEIAIEVRNRGQIAVELVPTILDPNRIRARAHPASGLGLGVYISDQIVSAHGGSLEISSEFHETTVFVVFPRQATAGVRVFDKPGAAWNRILQAIANEASMPGLDAAARRPVRQGPKRAISLARRAPSDRGEARQPVGRALINRAAFAAHARGRRRPPA